MQPSAVFGLMRMGPLPVAVVGLGEMARLPPAVFGLTGMAPQPAAVVGLTRMAALPAAVVALRGMAPQQVTVGCWQKPVFRSSIARPRRCGEQGNKTHQLILTNDHDIWPHSVLLTPGCRWVPSRLPPNQGMMVSEECVFTCNASCLSS